jgi:hypothetical protein
MVLEVVIVILEVVVVVSEVVTKKKLDVHHLGFRSRWNEKKP